MGFWALSPLHVKITPHPLPQRASCYRFLGMAFPDVFVSEFLFISVELYDTEQMGNVPVSLTISHHEHLSVS